MSEKTYQLLLELARGSGPVGEKLAVAIQAQMAGGQQQQQIPRSATSTWDTRYTDQRIMTLNPKVQPSAFAFINEVEAKLGFRLRVTQALRTIADQNALYAQGRTAPGNRVTKARGGQSYHNYGLALDVVEIELNGNVNWRKGDMPFWNSVAAIGISHGFDWGGNFKNGADLPHFEMTFGFTHQQLQNGATP